MGTKPGRARMEFSSATSIRPEMSASKLGVSALLRLKGAENGTDELYSRADYRNAVGGRGSVVRRREDGVDMPRFPGPGQRGEGQKDIWRGPVAFQQYYSSIDL